MLRASLVALALLLVAPAAGATPKPRRQHVAATPVAAPADHVVEVLWGGQWWRATVLKERKGFTKIHYVGWGAEYDEWVEVDRVRQVAAAAPATKPGQRRVEILWGGQWWPGFVLETRSGLHKIHYEGWGAEWDQWVESSRLRAPASRSYRVERQPRAPTRSRYGKVL